MPFLDQPRPLAFAHRGGAAHAPENSWRAFEHAVKTGYAYLETDVRATLDGELVAFHDRTLDRVTDGTGPVGDWAYPDLSTVRIAGTEPIPRLEDLLGAWPDLRFNIDLKDVASVALLPSVLARTAAWDRVCVTSFSGARLRAFRVLASAPVCLGLPPAALAAVRFRAARFSAVRLGAGAGAGTSTSTSTGTGTGTGPGWRRRAEGPAPACAQVPASVASPAFIRRAHALGLDVHIWTVNRKADMIRMLDRGADGIITDQIVMLRDVLLARGQWHPRP